MEQYWGDCHRWDFMGKTMSDYTNVILVEGAIRDYWNDSTSASTYVCRCCGESVRFDGEVHRCSKEGFCK